MKQPFPKRLLPPAPAYTLPLSRRAFRKALICGQGRAVLHVLQFGSEGVEDLILEALQFPPAYDSQCDPRHDYLWRLIQCAKMEMTTRLCIQFHIRHTKVNWARHQMFEILALMHQSGDSQALPILARAALHDIGDSTGNGISWWIRFDAEKAVPALMDFYGEELLEDAEAEIPWIINSCSEDEKKSKVMEIAKRHITESAAARKYYETTEMEVRGAIEASEDKASQPDADALIQMARASSNCYLFPRWIEALDAAGLNKIQAALEKELDASVRECLMQVFSAARAPSMDAIWLRWARSRESLGFRTRGAMSHFDHPSITRLGCRLLKSKDSAPSASPSSPCASEGVQLLGERIPARAHKLILQRLRGLGVGRESRTLHCSQARHLYKTHNWSSALASKTERKFSPSLNVSMFWVWQEAPCKECRQKAFENLAATGALPPEILAEAIHDACESTRGLAKKMLGIGMIEPH